MEELLEPQAELELLMWKQVQLRLEQEEQWQEPPMEQSWDWG